MLALFEPGARDGPLGEARFGAWVALGSETGDGAGNSVGSVTARGQRGAVMYPAAGEGNPSKGEQVDRSSVVSPSGSSRGTDGVKGDQPVPGTRCNMRGAVRRKNCRGGEKPRGWSRGSCGRGPPSLEGNFEVGAAACIVMSGRGHTKWVKSMRGKVGRSSSDGGTPGSSRCSTSESRQDHGGR